LILHQQYKLRQVLNAAAAKFNREKSIQLHQFLLPDTANRAGAALSRVPLREHYVPDQYHCHEPKTIPAIVKKLQRWLRSKEAAMLISTIVQKKVRFKESCLCVYTHRDYTLRHDKNKEPPGYDVILDLTPHWDTRACGHHSYVDRKGNELVRIPVAGNTLAIVHRTADVQKFVKYVNHHAGKDRRIVLEARFA